MNGGPHGRLRALRIFRADSAERALADVRLALGDRAVIVESRSVGGWLSRPRIEVTAMVEGDGDAPPLSGRQSHQPDPIRAAVAPGAAPADPHSQEELSRILSLAARIESKLDGLRRPPAGPAGGLTPRPMPLPPALVAAHTPWLPLAAALAARGVPGDLAAALAERSHDLAGSTGHGDAAGEPPRETLAHLLRKQVACVAPPWRKRENGAATRMFALCGPTGGGKTLSAVKIAARAALESGSSVALVSTDVERVGQRAVIEHYARLMNVTLRFAGDGPALLEAVRGLRDRDLIVIDSAGCARPDARERQIGLLRTVPSVEVMLVMPATLSALDADAQCEHYAAAAPRSLLFTKIDEAVGPGAILSSLGRLPIPVAGLANGQAIPGDLLPATTQSVVSLTIDLMLGAT